MALVQLLQPQFWAFKHPLFHGELKGLWGRFQVAQVVTIARLEKGIAALHGGAVFEHGFEDSAANRAAFSMVSRHPPMDNDQDQHPVYKRLREILEVSILFLSRGKLSYLFK